MPSPEYQRNPYDSFVHGAVAIVLIISVTVLGVVHILDSSAILAVLISGGGATAVLTVADHILYGPTQRKGG